MAVAFVARWLKAADAFYRARVSSKSAFAYLARFSAFGRRVLWWLDWGHHCCVHPDASLEVTVVEDRRRVRAGDSFGQCAGPPRMFFRRLLLGQADEFALGSAVLRAGSRSNWCSNRHEAASDT